MRQQPARTSEAGQGAAAAGAARVTEAVVLTKPRRGDRRPGQHNLLNLNPSSASGFFLNSITEGFRVTSEKHKDPLTL